MKNILFSIAAISTAVIFFSACKKKEENKCTGGSGGSLTIVAFPKHHGAYTQARWVYVKYNTLRFQGINASDYDLQIEADSSANYIKIENVKCGDYYIYMLAFDSVVNHAVSGGVAFRAEQTTGEVNADVPVTE